MFNQYQQKAKVTFKEHQPLNEYAARMLNWGIGLGGEAGEVEELIKHHIFAEEPLDKMKLAKELGDALWYIAAISTTAEINLEDVAQLNIEKLDHRYYTGAYTDGEAQGRHQRESLFSDTPIYQILRARILKETAPLNIILVGPDGSGKTTIAKQLAETLGFKYHKCNYQQEDKPALSKQLLETQINVVYDRFYWPDDPLYCGVKGIEMPEAYWQQYDAVFDLCKVRNVIFLYVDASIETLLVRSKVWADNYIGQSDLNEIISRYNDWKQLMQQHKIPVFNIDTTNVNIGTLEYTAMLQSILQIILIAQCGFISNNLL